MEIVASAEGLGADARAMSRNLPTRRVQMHDAVLVIGDEYLAVVSNFSARSDCHHTPSLRSILGSA